MTRAAGAAGAGTRAPDGSMALGGSGSLGGRNVSASRIPVLLTPQEVAGLLRTSKGAVYAMAERAQLPGIVRIGRRLLFREDALLEWLRQKSTPSPER